MLLTILISFFIVSIFGVVLHYTHKWFKNGFLLHVFSAINESTWEHNKLAFFPMLLTVIIHGFLPEFNYTGYWGSAFIVILSSVILIPLLYYPIKFVIGKEVTAVSISLYFVCIALSFSIEYILVSNKIYTIKDSWGQLGILLIFILFALFTYYPPKNFLFKDPIHRKYGEFKQIFDRKNNKP